MWIGIAAACVAALVALVKLWNNFLEGVREQGREQVRLEFAGRDNEALRDALARVEELQKELRAREAEASRRLAELSAQHDKDTQDANAKNDRFIAGLRDGSLILRDPGATTGSADGSGAASGAAASASGQCDAKERGQLSGAAAEFLRRLTFESDTNTRDLTQAQGVIEAYQKACAPAR